MLYVDINQYLIGIDTALDAVSMIWKVRKHDLPENGGCNQGAEPATRYSQAG